MDLKPLMEAGNDTMVKGQLVDSSLAESSPVDMVPDSAANGDNEEADAAELASIQALSKGGGRFAELSSEGEVEVEFLTGQAGTGKTHTIRQRQAADPKYAVVTATTGIAAVNLGAITLNSVLRYFNTESLEEAFFNGWLERALLTEILQQGYSNLVVDEISMMHYQQLDLIYQAAKRVNLRRADLGRSQLRLVLTGDFCQLPPIPDKESANPKDIPWAFKAQCWPAFAEATTKLTKVWRQSDARFLEAINLIRSGAGWPGAMLLRDIGVEFVPKVSYTYDGTTIISKNDKVDSFNWLALSKLAGVPITFNSSRWGKDRAEWKNIPPQLQLKKGAYVMILTNDTPAFTFVNGDCGHIVEADEATIAIKLIRTGQEVSVGYIQRPTVQRSIPDELAFELGPHITEHDLHNKYSIAKHPELAKQTHWNADKRRWVLGGITFMPVRLAYASTVHKTQGLSLDKVQVDCYNHFFGFPAMAYVALSRCRTPGGLRIVGTPQLLAQRVSVSPEVKEWL